MSQATSSPPRDVSEEVSALIATLHATEQRLEELTAGEVDTVADGNGRTFVLGPAREQLRHSEAEKQARSEAKEHLQSAALNAVANAVIITERDFTIVWMNPGFTELTGYTDEEAIGRNEQDLLRSGAHDEAFYKEIRDTIFSGKSWTGEMTNRRKDGRPYREASIITPVKDDQGKINHFVSIKTDLTHQRQMEAQLRQAQKMEAVGQLAAGVAHEFNNLLQALMSMATIVRLRSADPKIVKIGTEMELQIARGASITQQLLLFSRSHPAEKSNIDLREKVRKAGILLRQLIPENIKVVIETPPHRLRC